jgi:cyclic peptide transporter
MSLIWEHLRARLGSIGVAALLSAGSATSSILLLGYLGGLASEGVSAPGRAATQGLGLLLLSLLANLASQTFLARLGSDIVAALRLDISRRYLQVEYDQLLAIGKHQVTGSLIVDVGRVAALLLVLPTFTFNAVLVLACLGYLLLLSPALFGVFAGVVAFALASSVWLMNIASRSFGTLREAEGELFEAFRAIAEGKKELTLNPGRAEHFLDEEIASAVERTRRLGYEAQRWWGYSSGWSQVLVLLALLVVVLAGDSWLSVQASTLVRFGLATLFLTSPLNYLIVASQDVVVGLASARKLRALGLGPARAALLPGPPPRWSTLAARGLTYRYREDEPHPFSLGPLDLTVTRGEILFVVGGNGSGKSTLALLLAGLLRPSDGALLLDGQPVTEEQLPTYRQLFTAVFHDFHLFRSALDRAGQPAPDSQTLALLDQLELGHKVSVRDGQLSTLELSMGQRKRLALAQCYLQDADIYLFDEWAADQDPEFKEYFYHTLLPELRRRGRTVVAITHDDRYFGCADRHVTLESGQLRP